MNDSSDIRHPKETPGNTHQRFLLGKRVLPSIRPEISTKYLSA